MNRLHVSLLGKFHMQLGEHVLTGLNTTKIRDLLCYLLLFVFVKRKGTHLMIEKGRSL